MTGNAPAQKEAREVPRYLVIHHTDMAQPEQAQLVDQSHWRRGYGPSKIINPKTGTGWHTAYHFLVGKDGSVLQTRELDERTQHTACGLGLEKCVGDPEVNDQAIAIVLAGDFEHEEPTKAQVAALKKLVRDLDARFHFEKIMGHREASPTSCPGTKLLAAIKDILRDGKPTEEPWQITRYYTPVPDQKRYYRPEGYEADFKVNCSGDCLVTADGYRLRPEDAFKVAACPPEMPFGTKLQIDGIGTVVCRDRGSAIQKRKIDVWAGIGDVGLKNILTTKGGPRAVRIL